MWSSVPPIPFERRHFRNARDHCRWQGLPSSVPPSYNLATQRHLETVLLQPLLAVHWLQLQRHSSRNDLDLIGEVTLRTSSPHTMKLGSCSSSHGSLGPDPGLCIASCANAHLLGAVFTNNGVPSRKDLAHRVLARPISLYLARSFWENDALQDA